MEDLTLTSLADLPSGSHSLVRRLQGGKGFVCRMAALGFTVGAEVKIMQNQKHGPLIALIRNTRVALGRGEARKVIVATINHE